MQLNFFKKCLTLAIEKCFNSCRQILREIGYQAGQHELLADNLIKVRGNRRIFDYLTIWIFEYLNIWLKWEQIVEYLHRKKNFCATLRNDNLIKVRPARRIFAQKKTFVQHWEGTNGKLHNFLRSIPILIKVRANRRIFAQKNCNIET